MTNVEELSRRVDMSAIISDYVYDYENIYNWSLQEGTDEAQAKDNAVSKISKELNDDGLRLVDANYDSDTGIAAIAVYDEQTKETYIAYAGTNWAADNWKDIISDMAIGTNNSLYLKKLGDTAVVFYDRVHRTGAHITVTTGHSYGDFSASRVAIERQVPYQFGFQGAPQYVSEKTAQEMALEKLQSRRDRRPRRPLIEVDKEARDSREEVNRVKQLIESYSGYAVTFSTAGDVLTNALWHQSDEPIDYGVETSFMTSPSMVFGASVLLGTVPDTHYVGKVVAVDTGTPHSMYLYRKNEDTMRYTREIVLAQVMSADIDGDGIKDFALTPEYLTKQSLIPKFTISGDGQTIQLDTEAMAVLQSNLSVVKGQLEELLTQTAQAISENNEVRAHLAARRQKLKDAIMNELEQVGLVQAIKDIDTVFMALEELAPALRTLSVYNTHEFKRKFDAWGSSGRYAWYGDGQASTHWDYGSVSIPLDRMVDASITLLARINSGNRHHVGASRWSPTFYSQLSHTDVANMGAATINSFEQIIEETTKGLANRNQFNDGIPEAVGEILEVVAANLTTLVSCTQHLIEVCHAIRETLVVTDERLATSIQKFDTSTLSVPPVTVASSYERFLKRSHVFDDKQVLIAFDDAVNQHAEYLSGQMAAAFDWYLSAVQAEIRAINGPLTDVIDALYSINHQLPQPIYYREETYRHMGLRDIVNSQKKLYYYGSVSDQISIASTISAIYSDTGGTASVRRTDQLMTTALTTINTVYSMLGGFKEPFRVAMEDAFYGTEGLAGIVNMQRIVGAVLDAMSARFIEFRASLSRHSGAAIVALTDKVDETATTMRYVSDMIRDCFGG